MIAVGTYAYAETNYANPHALTGYFNGAATTYTYDNIGNLASTTGAGHGTVASAQLRAENLLVRMVALSSSSCPSWVACRTALW